MLYQQAIDVYMAVCLTFVFLGLVEFAYVNVLTRAERKEPAEKRVGLKVADVALKTQVDKTKPVRYFQSFDIVSCTFEKRNQDLKKNDANIMNERLCFSQ
jgi:hypothetical protein